jgi:hypothetical protein
MHLFACMHAWNVSLAKLKIETTNCQVGTKLVKCILTIVSITKLNTTCNFDYILIFNNICYMILKLEFKFRKNEYKKTYNILKNGFT